MIRFKAYVVLAGLLALTTGPVGAMAQESASAPPPKAPSAAPPLVNPRGPIPYTALVKRPAAKSAAKPAAKTAAAKPAAAAPIVPTGTVAGLPVSPTGSRLLPGEPLPPAELESFVDGLVKDAMAREHIAGVSVSVVQNGQILLKKGYGFANLSPRRRVDADATLFRLGDISKTFTWIALMREVEAGRIRINAPVNLYLPERQQVKDQGYQTPVRVENLMDHSAGFEDRSLGQIFERRFNRERPLTEYIRQERPRRVSEPGAVSSYSNYGAALAGLAVTYVSGKSFERFVEDEITGPLALRHTTFREPHPVKTGLPAPMPARLIGDVATGYRWTPSGFEPRGFEYIGHIAPAAAASSSGGDMARYMLMLLGNGSLEGATIFGPKSAQAFRTPMRQTPAGINGWAHGFMVYDLPGGHRGYGHDGATLSFMSNMVVAPDLNLGVFVAANTDTGQSLAQRLPGRIVAQFYAPPAPFPRAGSAALAKAANLYRGRFIGVQRTYGGLEGFVDLLNKGVDVDVSPEGRLVTRGPDGTQIWTPAGEASRGRFLAAQGDEALAFRMGQNGAASFETATGGLFLRTSVWMKPRTLQIFAALTAIASIATLAGVALRNRREFRENDIQSRASLVQNSQAVLWLISLALFAAWMMKTRDPAELVYGWPGPFLVIASACAFVAGLMTLATLIFTPAIWRGGRRVDSWSALRKIFFTMTVLISSVFTVLLGLWGAIWPWSG